MWQMWQNGRKQQKLWQLGLPQLFLNPPRCGGHWAAAPPWSCVQQSSWWRSSRWARWAGAGARRWVACSQTKPFSTIYANTPWQVLHSPTRICQRGVAGFFLASPQRAENEITVLCEITFLSPGRFLYFLLYLLCNKMSSKEMRTTNRSFSTD